LIVVLSYGFFSYSLWRRWRRWWCAWRCGRRCWRACIRRRCFQTCCTIGASWSFRVTHLMAVWTHVAERETEVFLSDQPEKGFYGDGPVCPAFVTWSQRWSRASQSVTSTHPTRYFTYFITLENKNAIKKTKN
jgi:hypothetical protein